MRHDPTTGEVHYQAKAESGLGPREHTFKRNDFLARLLQHVPERCRDADPRIPPRSRRDPQDLHHLDKKRSLPARAPPNEKATAIP